MRRTTVAAAGAVVALAAWSCSTAAPPEPESEGARLYLANCAACHGQDAAGLKGPNLRTGLDADYVATTITEGKGGMPSFENSLSPDQIRTLADYIDRIGQGEAQE